MLDQVLLVIINYTDTFIGFEMENTALHNELQALRQLKELAEIIYRTNDNVDTETEHFYKIGPVIMSKLGDILHAIDKTKVI